MVVIPGLTSDSASAVCFIYVIPLSINVFKCFLMFSGALDMWCCLKKALYPFKFYSLVPLKLFCLTLPFKFASFVLRLLEAFFFNLMLPPSLNKCPNALFHVILN